jgi:UDP:flavonoid glycosyltransferase YjiC (YdhE family)
MIVRCGARFARPSLGSLVDMDDLEESAPQIVGLSGPDRASWFIEHVLVAPIVGQYRDLREVLGGFDADVILADSIFLGGSLLYELDRRLWATLSVAPLAIPDPDVPPFGPGWPPATTGLQRAQIRILRRIAETTVLKRPTQRMNRERARLNLPPVRSVFDGNATPYLYMQATSPQFEYPRREPPAQLHFVGPLFPEPSGGATLPAWWQDLDSDRPKVLVTQGTLSTSAQDLITPTVRALAGADLLLVATTDQVLSKLGVDPAPENLRVEPFLPFDTLMPRLDAVVTNGGYGTVQLALRHGLPLVVAGQTDDKPEVCARVAWSGAGINLGTSRPEPRQIREAVATVLTDDSHRSSARRIAADFAAYDAPVAIAMLLEQLVATGAMVRAPDAGRALGPVDPRATL